MQTKYESGRFPVPVSPPISASINTHSEISETLPAWTPSVFSNHDTNSYDYGHDLDQQTDRIAIFIDAANLFHAAFQIGIEIDYEKLIPCLTGGRHLLHAYFYTGVDPKNDRQYRFLQWMRRNGYRVITKDLISLPDGSKKVDLDVEMAIDMMTVSQHCRSIVLLSGDGNLAYALNAISYQGVRVEVVSLRSMTHNTLINLADQYTDLQKIQQEICKKPKNATTHASI